MASTDVPDMLPSWHLANWQRLLENRRAGRLAHALLLSGPAGLGKGLFARQLANLLVCEQGVEVDAPCGQCKACRLVQAGSHPDIKCIEPEEPGKQLKVEQIRALGSGSVLTAQESGYRVFIIDPADAMNAAAANALLKTLEEPVPSALLILVSSQPHRLPATIISRCQRVPFQSPALEDGVAWLAGQGVECERASRLLGLLGQAPYAALSAEASGLLEAHDPAQKDFFALVQGSGDPLALAQTWKSQQLDLLLAWMVLWLSDLLQLQASASTSRLFSIRDQAHLQTLAKGLDSKRLYLYLDQVQEMRRQLARNLNPELILETLLVEWARLGRRR